MQQEKPPAFPEVNCTPFVRQVLYHTYLTNGVQFSRGIGLFFFKFAEEDAQQQDDGENDGGQDAGF